MCEFRLGEPEKWAGHVSEGSGQAGPLGSLTGKVGKEGEGMPEGVRRCGTGN